jgi:DNA-directed RNA polymerase subunit omega
MAQVAIEDLLKRCGSIYRLVLLAAKRAKEVAEGAPPLVETPYRKATSIALEEILQGKVLYKTEEPEAGSGKKGRGTKAKDEKKKRAAA